tara:strand:- start:849 stop:1337 length:489 start_codon:yes stop_codon:yes gene_type:complete
MENSLYFNDLWSLYFHDPNENDWSIQSYIFISNISSLDKFCIIFKFFKDYWTKGMFFIMREYVTPRWEDENNIHGGCFSIKVLPDELEKVWFDISASVLGESLAVNEEHSLNINGISISPKKNYYIIRIWCKDDSITKREFYNIPLLKKTTILYKKHSECDT